MKDLFSKIIGNLHIFIVLYGLWTTYEIYEAHTAELEQVQSQIAGVDAEIATNQQKVKEIQDFVKKLNEYKIRIEEVAKNNNYHLSQEPSTERIPLLKARTESLVDALYNAHEKADFERLYSALERISDSIMSLDLPSIVRPDRLKLKKQAKQIKKVVEIPVIGIGRITEPIYANKLIQEGYVDLVAVGRALLKDPKWVIKAIKILERT